MVFSDTTNKTGILQRMEFNLGLPDGAITGDSTLLAHSTSMVNETYYDLFLEIIEAQDTWDFDDSNHADFAIATTPLVADQRDYTFPTSLEILRIKRTDVTYDDIEYHRSTPLDSAEIGRGLGSDSKTDNYYTSTEPHHDFKANTLWLYPRPTASVGEIRIEFTRQLDDFVVGDTTQEPGIDRPFHELIPLGAAMKYAVLRNMESAGNLKVLYAEGLERIRQYYTRKIEDKETSLNSPYGRKSFT